MIYLLEDDDSIRKLVVYALESQGFRAEGFEEPGAFWKAMEQKLPELVLLDIMLPEEDGIQILRRLRAQASTKALPVIMLTARNTEYDRVEGLDAGADDYISKPFGMVELIARVESVLRRAGKAEEHYEIGDVRVEPRSMLVTKNGVPVTLTPKEYELLLLFVRNRNIALFRDTIYQRVWEAEFDGDSRTVDLHVQRLRKKLGWQKRLVAIYKVGYRLEDLK